ncbi:DUF1398 family protein [Mucilaginibacter sp. CAU 1740]|uniref:DUF1398 domain-containing protein n=1 Tax=Mucilaginibacter sp. CAU 1740 TaxID=3140365 RepID=UPI00325B7F86
MFTEQQLKAAHSKVKTGADFPAYINEIKGLGLLRYEFWVDNGRTIYYGGNSHVIATESKYPEQGISTGSSADELRHIITIHQQGQTDFNTFCKQVAHAGVEKWVIDTSLMTCTYCNLKGQVMVSEPIPEIKY